MPDLLSATIAANPRISSGSIGRNIVRPRNASALDESESEMARCVCVKLVDPASSHMLVLKIKPCMFKFIPLNGETANGSLNQL